MKDPPFCDTYLYHHFMNSAYSISYQRKTSNLVFAKYRSQSVRKIMINEVSDTDI